MPSDPNGLTALADIREELRQNREDFRQNREDLRSHNEGDTQQFGQLQGGLTGIRNDITGLSGQVGLLRGELVNHGDTLARIEKSLSRRARTEETLIVDTERFKKRRNLTILKAALGVFASGAAITIGALLHRYLG